MTTGSGSEGYAAELLLDEPLDVLDDFESDEDDFDSEDEADVDDFAGADGAGELLDEEPRLSFR
jgi:hypothetical protein